MPDKQPTKPPAPSPDRKHDEAVEESFPASDPPASTGTTGPGRTGPKPERE